ncbi:hypothetical protein TNCV_1234011 [Trichonephila clavipes]|nr:hypothetical protein TNCV_1234011 [Trichonephila clavipes]
MFFIGLKKRQKYLSSEKEDGTQTASNSNGLYIHLRFPRTFYNIMAQLLEIKFFYTDQTILFLSPKAQKPIGIILFNRWNSAAHHWLPPSKATPPQPPKPRTHRKAYSVPDMEWRCLTRPQSP